MLYFSNNENFYLRENALNSVPCHAIDKYKKNIEEIKQRKEWKSKGTGAMFMGQATIDRNPDAAHIYPSDAVFADQNQMIYAARLEDGTAIYSKSLLDFQEVEALVLRKKDFIVHNMGYEKNRKRLVLSASVSGEYERHLSILEVEGNRIQYVTEGDCQDANPIFDPQNPDQVYYDSCGFAYDHHRRVMIGPKKICLLNLKTGELDTVMEHPDFDFLKPQKDGLGNLYFLKRPYKSKSDPFSILKDLIRAPFKLIKAIIGWLDFFTQNYAGESLKTTSGRNPAKNKPISEEELFIEDNLINVEKTRRQNANMGEKYPGIIPKSWELVVRSPSGELRTIKKGVLSYTVHDGQILYSNGELLVQIGSDQSETKLLEGKLITKIARA
ncbi:hypothetical protein [Aquirhabdus sp.]|uniref:hypothetical protein n=1 Tax=Aquirhabdus sp. TaxID=2824160 RepID=UPI00396C94C6